MNNIRDEIDKQCVWVSQTAFKLGRIPLLVSYIGTTKSGHVLVSGKAETDIDRHNLLFKSGIQAKKEQGKTMGKLLAVIVSADTQRSIYSSEEAKNINYNSLLPPKSKPIEGLISFCFEVSTSEVKSVFYAYERNSHGKLISVNHLDTSDWHPQQTGLAQSFVAGFSGQKFRHIVKMLRAH